MLLWEHDNVVKGYSPDFVHCTIQFWKELWEDSKQYNSQAAWISNVAAKLEHITPQKPVTITSEKVKL